MTKAKMVAAVLKYYPRLSDLAARRMVHGWGISEVFGRG
jgi:hypothetical protein